MDPAVFLLPEIILNEGQEFDRAHFSPPFSAESSAALQTSPEISNRQRCPTDPRLAMDESAAQRASRASEMTCTNSRFDFSPCVLTPFWYTPCEPPRPLDLLHQVHPQSVPFHQPCSPDLVLRRAAQQVDEQLYATPTSAATGREQHEEQAESEEGQQENVTPEQNELQANNTDDETTKANISPGSLPSLDEESLAERAFEEYMTIMDSLSLQIPEETEENEEDEKKRKVDSLVEYLEKQCSDEGFVTGATLQEHQPSGDDANIKPVDLMPNPEDSQDSILSADLEPIHVVLRELQHEQDSHLPSADSNAATEETPPATSHVQRAQSPVGAQSDTSPNHDGQNSPTSTRNMESKEGWTGSSPLPLEEPPQTDATTGCFNTVKIFDLINSSLQLLTNISPDTSFTSDVEARDSDAPVEEPAAIFPSEGASEESSNVADTQTSQNLQEGDPPSFEYSSTSSLSGSNMDTCTIAAKDSAPSFRADLLTVNPPAQIRKPEEYSPENTNLTPSCLEVYAVPVQANSSFVEDSHLETCDPPVDDLCDLVPEKQDLELQASQDVASSGVSSEEWCETDRKCEENLGKGVRMTVSQQAREEGGTFERKENKENETKLKGTTNKVQIRCSQRLSGRTKKEKARLSGDLIIEREDDKKPSEKSVKKTEKFSLGRDGVKQQRRSSRGRQLSEKEEDQETETANTEIEKMEQQQEPKVDGDVSTHIGAENALKEKDLGERTVQREEEELQMSGYVTRRSRSKAPEEKVEPTPPPATRTRGKIKLSEMVQNTTEARTLLVASQVSNKENVSGGSPRVKTAFHSTQDSIKDDQSLTDEINESPSVKSCETTPHVTPAFPPETQKRHRTVAGTTTLDFYSLRSGTHKPKVSKGKGVQENRTVEVHPSSPDHTAGVQGQSLTSSPMKRYRHDRESSEERRTRLNETEMISLSPMKRGRWRKKDEAQVETPSPPLRRSYRKTLDSSAGLETVVTRASREGTNKRQTQLSKQLPTKYKDLYKCQLGKEKGKAGRGRTARCGKKTVRFGLHLNRYH